MKGARAARVATMDEGSDLFERIGAFLAANRLSADPAHYSLAHRIMSDPDSDLALTAARLNGDGVRLSRREIEQLGGHAVAGAPVTRDAALPAEPSNNTADRLAAQASDQIDTVTAVLRAIHDETAVFGRDLAERAAAIGRMPPYLALDGIARITAAMIARVRQAETRLGAATDEVSDLREKLAEARDSARRDALTSLPNRRAFEEGCAAAGGGCCVALFDIDRFKRINDDFGHAVGDRVLVAIGAALTQACIGHLVARHGGEEFAILLAGVELDEATRLLDDARATVAARRFRSRDTGEALGVITVSAGVTALAPGEKVETALGRADRLLYSAKASGRNTVVAG